MADSKRKPGRPALVTNPKVVATVVGAVAKGDTQRQAAKAAGVSAPTACRVVAANRDQVEGMRDTLRELVLRKVLKGAETAIHARMRDSSNEDSKTGAQSFRACMEAAGIVGRAPFVVGGDVNVSVLDHSRHLHLSARSSAESEGRLRELEAALGIG